MPYSSEFEIQWQKMCDYLEEEMIRFCEQSGTIQFSHVVALLNNEKKRWKERGQCNYEWVEGLRHEGTDLADEFETALNATSLSQEYTDDKPSAILAALPVLVGALVGFIVPAFLRWKIIWIFVIGVGLTIIAGGISFRQYRIKKEGWIAAERRMYMRQLEAAGKTLVDILIKADSRENLRRKLQGRRVT